MSLSLPVNGDIKGSNGGSLYQPWDRKESIISKWIALVTQYGGSYESIGTCSVKGLDIIIFKFGNSNRSALLIDAHLHGNEFYGHETLYAFVKWLLSSNDTDALRILANNHVLVVPCLNYRFGRTNYTVRGTTQDPGDGDPIGVNINRNFANTWSSSLRTVNNDSNSGDHADSENETKALISAWTKYNVRVYYNLHQGSNTSTSVASTSAQAIADVNKIKSIAPTIASRLGASNWASGFSAGSKS